MKKIGIVLFGICLLLAGCNDNKEKENTNVCGVDCEKADMEGYDNFMDGDHVFLEVTFDEANTFIKDKEFSGIIYFGYATCPWCIEAVPIMNEVAKAQETNIYYVNKKSEANEAHPEWLKETTKLLDKAYGLDENDGETYLYVPEVIVIKEGKIVAHHMGTLDDHDATERKMTDKEQEELQKIYEELFEKLK